MTPRDPAPAPTLEPAAYAIVLGFIVPLALGALLSDWRFSTSFEVQWLNFADWLVAGSLLGGGAALAWSLIRTTVARRWGERGQVAAIVLLVAFLLVQSVNALVHAKDNYATMPAGLLLSLLATLVALAAAWSGFRADQRRTPR